MFTNASVLYSIWHGELGTAMTLGGYLPYADVAYYYNSMLSLINTGQMLPIGSERPFGILFFTSLLHICGMSLMGTFIVFNVMQSIAFILVSKIVCDSYGLGLSLLTGLGLIVININNHAKFILEAPACLFATLSFGLLIYGVQKKHSAPTLLGLLLLCIAQNIRLGPIMILPALSLFIAWHFRDKYLVSLKYLVVTMVIVFGSLFSNRLMVNIYGTNTTLVSNTGYFVYGLAHGGKSWQYAKQKHPELYLPNISEEARTSTINEYAIDHIKTNPTELIRGIMVNWSFALMNFPRLFLKSIQTLFNVIPIGGYFFKSILPMLMCILSYGYVIFSNVVKRRYDLILCLFITLVAILCSPITGMQASLFRLFRPTEIFALFPILFAMNSLIQSVIKFRQA